MQSTDKERNDGLATRQSEDQALHCCSKGISRIPGDTEAVTKASSTVANSTDSDLTTKNHEADQTDCGRTDHRGTRKASGPTRRDYMTEQRRMSQTGTWKWRVEGSAGAAEAEKLINVSAQSTRKLWSQQFTNQREALSGWCRVMRWWTEHSRPMAQEHIGSDRQPCCVNNRSIIKWRVPMILRKIPVTMWKAHETCWMMPERAWRSMWNPWPFSPMQASACRRPLPRATPCNRWWWSWPRNSKVDPTSETSALSGNNDPIYVLTATTEAGSRSQQKNWSDHEDSWRQGAWGHRERTEDAEIRMRSIAERECEHERERAGIRDHEHRLTEEADEQRLLLVEEEGLRVIEEKELERLMEAERKAFLIDQKESPSDEGWDQESFWRICDANCHSGCRKTRSASRRV